MVMQVKPNQPFAGKADLSLVFCWHPQASRFGICSRPSDRRLDSSFGTVLKTTLKGKMITGLRFPSPFERILELEISDKPTDAAVTHRLVLEVAGSRSNLVLVSSADESIVGCAYQVSTATSVRPLQLSGPYRPPPSNQGKLTPLDMSLQSFADRLASSASLPVAKALCEAVKGMSPNVAALIVREAECVPPINAGSLEPDRVKKLHSLAIRWAGDAHLCFILMLRLF